MTLQYSNTKTFFLKLPIQFIEEDQQGKEIYVHKNAQSRKVRNGLRDLNPLIHTLSQTQHVYGVKLVFPLPCEWLLRKHGMTSSLVPDYSLV